MRQDLEQVGLWNEMTRIANKLKLLLVDPHLDQGVCHMDLKPDNVHVTNGIIKVFDFDSAGWSWRSIEPYRALIESEEYFNAWLRGYREYRPFDDRNASAVMAFTVIAKIRDVVWELGRNPNSREQPKLRPDDLIEIVERWKSIVDRL